MDRGGDDDRRDDEERRKLQRPIGHDDGTDFDPSEFDTPAPPLSRPARTPEVQAMFAALGQVAADGVKRGSAPLLSAIENEGRERTAWNAAMTKTLRELEQTAHSLGVMERTQGLNFIKRLASAFIIAIAAMLVAAFAYRWAQEPKIEEKLYGCTGAYVTKTNTCKGKWIPLQRNDGN